MNKILVVIPHYDKLKYLTKCIECLDMQNTNIFDILVVDNGSVDGSVDYIVTQSNKNNNFHYILLSENLGFAPACNIGFKYSIDNNYHWTILLNNDAFIHKNFINSLYESIYNKKNIFAVSSLMISYKNRDLIDDFGDGYNIFGYAFQNKTGQKLNKIKQDEYVFSACGGASIYDNEKIKKVGLLDENFFAYLEDIDLCYRAKLYGYKVKTCKNAICYHLGSATSGSKYNKFKVHISARNNIYLIYKNMPNIQIIINFLPICIGTFFKLIYFIFNGYGLDYIKGIIDGFKNLNKIDRLNFRKINMFTFMSIEYQLIKNGFIYILDFLERKVNK